MNPAPDPTNPPAARFPDCEEMTDLDENGNLVVHKCPLYANNRRRGGEQFHCPGSGKTPAPIPAATAQWRELGVGDVLQEGDQYRYFEDSDWSNCAGTVWGITIARQFPAKYRRPLGATLAPSGPRVERCHYCGEMVPDWVDPDWAKGRVCRKCESVYEPRAATAAGETAAVEKAAKIIMEYCGRIRGDGSYPDPDARRIVQQAIDEAKAQPAAGETANNEMDKELGRWQEKISDLLFKLSGKKVNGVGCDSGDPLDLTLAEIELSWPQPADAAIARTVFDSLGINESFRAIFERGFIEGQKYKPADAGTEDGALLDWLEKSRLPVNIITKGEYTPGPTGPIRKTLFLGWIVGDGEDEHPTLRDAIRAARKGAL